jgi:methyl-accepting chemotaxis protein
MTTCVFAGMTNSSWEPSAHDLGHCEDNNAMSQNNQKRRHYLIAYRFQLRFALQILLLLIFTSLVIGWTVYYSVWAASEAQLHELIGRERIDQADAVQFRQAIRKPVGEKVLLRLLLLIFIAFVFTIFATHRMVGPIRHMEKNLQARLRGDPVQPIRLRRTDEFHDLANLINHVLLQELKSRIRDLESGT